MKKRLSKTEVRQRFRDMHDPGNFFIGRRETVPPITSQEIKRITKTLTEGINAKLKPIKPKAKVGDWICDKKSPDRIILVYKVDENGTCWSSGGVGICHEAVKKIPSVPDMIALWRATLRHQKELLKWFEATPSSKKAQWTRVQTAARALSKCRDRVLESV